MASPAGQEMSMRKVLALVAAGLLFLAPTVLGQAEEVPENASDASFLLEIGLPPAPAELQELDSEFLVSTWSPEILASAAGCIPASKCCKICNKGRLAGTAASAGATTATRGAVARAIRRKSAGEGSSAPEHSPGTCLGGQSAAGAATRVDASLQSPARGNGGPLNTRMARVWAHRAQPGRSRPEHSLAPVCLLGTCSAAPSAGCLSPGDL